MPVSLPARAAARPLVVALSALALASFASVASAQQAPIEREMSAEERRATGIDKLSPQELAALNAWLGRKIAVETTRAAEAAKEQVVEENRGLTLFGSGEPIQSRISGEFRGFAKGRSYTLDNGQVWQQVDDASLAGVRRDNPAVRITPSLIGRAWYLSIEGYNTRAKVERIK